MGKAIGAIAKPVTKLATAPLQALSPAASMLGLSLDKGQQGEYEQYGDLQSLLSNEDALADPIKGMQVANKQVQGSPFLKDLFGDKGLQSRVAQEEKDLAGRGFQLQKEDREAYGQTAGDVARLFGQQENEAAQSLARRGLGAGSSGAAGAMYSGLAGNKNEMLAKAQLDIAQKRMADTQNRLFQTRKLMQDLGSQGSDEASRQYDRQVANRQRRVGEISMAGQARDMANANKKAAYKPSLFETFGQGLQTGIGNLGAQAPGMIASGGMPGGGAASGGAPKPQGTQMSGQGYNRYGGYA